MSPDGGLTDASPVSVRPYASSITIPLSALNSRSSSADTQSPAARHSRSDAKSACEAPWSRVSANSAEGSIESTVGVLPRSSGSSSSPSNVRATTAVAPTLSAAKVT